MGQRGLRWDKVTADPDHRRLIFAYTFVNRLATSFSDLEKSQFLKDTRSNIINETRKKPDWPLEHGCAYFFNYCDKDGVYVLSFSVTAADLK